jgi:ABC-type bacteriocin/lantibiotic exporter with double-glycine peptidase domain
MTQRSGNFAIGALAVLALAISGCSTLKPLQHPQKLVLIEKVPFYPEDRYWCGPASLAGVMNYWRESPVPETIADKIYSPSAQGSLMSDLVWYAREQGFSARVESGSIRDLKRSIRQEIPPIVFVRQSTLLGNYDHFMVVVGYTSNGFVVNSGKKEKYLIEWSSFEKLWSANDQYVIYITPKNQMLSFSS